MAKTEEEVLSEFLTIIRNKWREQNGIQERVKVTLTKMESPEEDDEQPA